MLIRFDPLDTLFFRDGRPYHQGENTQTNVLSRFPPSPTTLVGAIRAAWARALGWSGQGRWRAAIRAQLGGDGTELGNGLRFRGPLLIDDCGSALFPLPASVLGREADDDRPTDLTLLRPTAPKGAKGFHCDLGTGVLLPAGPAEPKVEGLKVLEGWWVDAAGMARILLGMVPTAGQVRPRKALWHHEPRVAIERNLARTTGQGALYSPLHVRLQRGLTLAMLAEGLPQGVGLGEHVEAAPQAVGGESRACWIEIAADPTDALFPRSPALAADGDGLRYAVHVVTPLVLEMETPPLPELVIPGLPGELVSACLPRPQLWGGWDSIGRVPHALRPHLAPGSVLFMRAAAADTATVSVLHGKTIGGSASWGYGLIFIGTW